MDEAANAVLDRGLPGNGKTIAARRIEVEQNAVRLRKDEWVKALHGHDNLPSARDLMKGRVVQIGLRVPELGNNVVIEYGLWGRDERSALRKAAADRGASVEIANSTSIEQSSDLALINAQTKSLIRRGTCPTMSSPNGRPTSTSQRQVNAMAVSLSMTRRLVTRRGTSGAGIVGPRRSHDAGTTGSHRHGRSLAVASKGAMQSTTRHRQSRPAYRGCRPAELFMSQRTETDSCARADV
ncbi:MAG: AAA family ATPase [Terracoccus sp.]